MRAGDAKIIKHDEKSKDL